MAGYVNEVYICNLALAELGAERITALDEDSEQARLCNDIFKAVRDQVIAIHPWNFAIVRKELGLLSTDPEYGYDNQHQIPTDSIRILNANDGTDRLDRIRDWKVEGDKLLSCSTTVWIRYIARIEDTTKYSAGFVKAFAGELASELAYPITHSKTLATALREKYVEETLPNAKRMDSQEGTPVPVKDDRWVNSRRTFLRGDPSRSYS